MELVSVLAGERWSDHPSCTDPTLATIARVVNDELTGTSRQALAPMAGTPSGAPAIRRAWLPCWSVRAWLPHSGFSPARPARCLTCEALVHAGAGHLPVG